MRIEAEQIDRRFVYRLSLDSDDRTECVRGFADAPTPLRLVRHHYLVELPEVFSGIHPDVHAAAVWYVLRPLIGSRLELTFGVSEQFASSMLDSYGVIFPNVDSGQQPRRAPARFRPCVMFSGGMDSVAASLVFPEDTEHVFLDRIPHGVRDPASEALVDLARQRDTCGFLAAMGRRVHLTADDHEALFAPYPVWHSDMNLLSALYLADSLGLAVLDTGEVLDAVSFGGYHLGARDSWRFRRQRNSPVRVPDTHGSPSRRFLGFVGLAWAQSIGGLSEVATTAIVSKSPMRGKSFSCYYDSQEFFCMKCDKCFKKLLLRYIADGEKVPNELVDRFLAVPRLAAIFARPYFDWHHVWYYIFQQASSDHPFMRELQSQARQGPDLSMLARWYPPSYDGMVPEYRDSIVERIQRQVGSMSAAEVAALEGIDVPPLFAPRRHIAAPARSVGRTGAARECAPATKALYEWLRGLVQVGPLPTWSRVKVSDIFIRPDRESVFVELKLHGRPAALPAPEPAQADHLVLMLARLSTDDQKALVKLGTVGVSYLRSTPLDRPWRRVALKAFIVHLTRRQKEARQGPRAAEAPVQRC